MTPARYPALHLRPIAAITAPLLVFISTAAYCQEFDLPERAGPSSSPALLIERALPEQDAGSRLDLLGISWSGLGDFTTRSLAIGAGSGPIRLAFGFASTGDAEIGWNSAALAAGFAIERCGAAIRAIARRDRSPLEREVEGERGVRPVGVECGAGFWSRLGSRARIWASMPALYGAGESAPLDRGLETGIIGGTPDVRVWLSWSAPARAADQGERGAGVEINAGPATIWLAARDRPFRGTVGMRARRGLIEIAADATEHPVLGQTLRLALTLDRSRFRPAGATEDR